MRTMTRNARQWSMNVVAAIFLTIGSTCAAEPAKLALVIGNSLYGGGHDLPNAANSLRLLSLARHQRRRDVAMCSRPRPRPHRPHDGRAQR